MTRRLLLALLLAPVSVAAQRQEDGEVFLAREIDRVPRELGRPAGYYPQGYPGSRGPVIVTFVIDTTGRVEPVSVKIDKTPDRALGAAARLTVLESRFEPGRFRGQKVRVLMTKRLVVKPTPNDCQYTIVADSIPLCVDSTSVRTP